MTSQTVKVKLVTIICGSEMEDRLARGLRSLGCVHGYTSTHANGRGLHGQRTAGFLDGGNLRIELIPSVGDDVKVMEFLAAVEVDPIFGPRGSTVKVEPASSYAVCILQTIHILVVSSRVPSSQSVHGSARPSQVRRVAIELAMRAA